MNIKLNTIEEVTTFIEKANTLLGYPDGNGTETYCNIPEISEDNIYYLPVTTELNEKMINIALKTML